MAKSPLQEISRGSYVYEIVVDGVVRYIGKGTGDRVVRHFKKAQQCMRARRAGERIRITRFYDLLSDALNRGLVVGYNIVASDLTSEAALEREISEIASVPSSQLWNVLPGGLGVTSECMKHRWADPAWRRKITDNRNDPQYRARVSQRMRAAWKDPEIRVAMIGAKRRSNTVEVRRRASEKQKSVWAETDFRKRISNRWADGDRVEMAREKAIQAWRDNPGWRSRRFADSSAREKQSAMLRAKWSDPAYREMQKSARASAKKKRCQDDQPRQGPPLSRRVM